MCKKRTKNLFTKAEPNNIQRQQIIQGISIELKKMNETINEEPEVEELWNAIKETIVSPTQKTRQSTVSTKKKEWMTDQILK